MEASHEEELKDAESANKKRRKKSRKQKKKRALRQERTLKEGTKEYAYKRNLLFYGPERADVIGVHGRQNKRQARRPTYI